MSSPLPRSAVVNTPRTRHSKRAPTSGLRSAPAHAPCLYSCSIVRSTRDETRTRKTRRSGDFESPASTNSATRALWQCSRAVSLAQRNGRGRSSRHGTTTTQCRCARPSLLPDILEAPAEIVLNADVHRALNRAHERGEIALLALRNVEPLPLDLERPVEQPGDRRLVGGITGEDLGAQCLPHLTFFAQ